VPCLAGRRGGSASSGRMPNGQGGSPKPCKRARRLPLHEGEAPSSPSGDSYQSDSVTPSRQSKRCSLQPLQEAHDGEAPSELDDDCELDEELPENPERDTAQSCAAFLSTFACELGLDIKVWSGVDLFHVLLLVDEQPQGKAAELFSVSGNGLR
jgi:hypothetical protein